MIINADKHALFFSLKQQLMSTRMTLHVPLQP